MHGLRGSVCRWILVLVHIAQVWTLNVTISGTLSLTGTSEDAAKSLEALAGLQLIIGLLPSHWVFDNITLDIRDDGGSAAEVRRHYEQMLQDANQPVPPGEEINLRVFLGPISAELSEVASNLTSAHSVPIMLPFVSLPERQKAQVAGKTWTHSLEVPAELLMQRPVRTYHARGAQTIGIWDEAEPYLAGMCQGAAAEATSLGMSLVYQHRSSERDNALEDMRLLARRGPDVLIVCADYRKGVEIIMTLDFLHFSPQAILMWDSSRPEFSEALLAASSLNIMTPEIWSSRIEPCNLQPCHNSVTRATFAGAYQSLNGVEPPLYAAQAAAAAVAMTSMHTAQLAELLSLPAIPVFRDLNRQIVNSLQSCDNKESFYQLLCFNSHGYLAAPLLGLSQLVALNITDGRRLQLGPQDQGQSNGQGPGQGPGQGQGPTQPPPPVADPISTATLLAYTRLTPQLLEVYQVSEGSSPLPTLDYPRPSEDSRRLVRYPCEPGFEVVTASLFSMLSNVAANDTSAGPNTPCYPCLDGTSRNTRSPECTACKVGTQATSQGQSECTDCLQGAVCNPSNSTLVVAPNFYYLHGLLLPCDVQGRCLGENVCLGNSSGAMCWHCKSGWVSDQTRAAMDPDPCRPCEDEWRSKWHRIIVGVCLYFLAFVCLLVSHLNACFSLSSTSALALRSLMNYFQFTAITAKTMDTTFLASYMPNTQEYFRLVGSLILDPIAEVPVSCFIPQWKPYQVKVLIGFCILPLVFTASFVILFTWEFIVAPLLFQTCCSQGVLDDEDYGEVKRGRGKSIHHTHSMEFGAASKPTLKRLFASVSEAGMIWCHLLLPMSLYNMLGAVLCVDPQDSAVSTVDYPRPVTVLLSDLGLKCDDPSHQPWMILAIGGLAIYGFALPCGMLFAVHTMHSEHWLAERAFGYFLHGSRPEYLYTSFVKLLVLAAAVVISAVRTLSVFLRLQCLLGICAAVILVLSSTRPYDDRDQSVLLKMEVSSMACQLLGLSLVVITSPWASSLNEFAFGSLIEVVQIPGHLYFMWLVLVTLVNNAVVKRIRYAPEVTDLLLPEQWLHGFLDMHSDKVVLEVSTCELDISGLSRHSKANLRAALTSVLRHYMEAAATGVIPWSEVGCEADFEEMAMDEEEGARGLLYLGFLSAAIKEMMLEAEASRMIKHEMMRSSSFVSDFVLWVRSFFIEAVSGPQRPDFSRGMSIEEAMSAVQKKPQLTSTTEELVMASMLLLEGIEAGAIVFYDVQAKQGPRREAVHVESDTKAIHEWQDSQPIDEFLAELTTTTKQPPTEDDDDASNADFFEVPDPTPNPDNNQHGDDGVEDRPLPALLQGRSKEETETLPSSQGAVFAHTLGLQTASAAQAEYCALQEEHDGCFAEIFELKAEIQDLRRRTLEAQTELKHFEMEQSGVDNVKTDEHSERLTREGSSQVIGGKQDKNKKVAEQLGVLGFRQGKQPVQGKAADTAQHKKSPRTPRRAATLKGGITGYVAIEVEPGGPEDADLGEPDTSPESESQSKRMEDAPVAKPLAKNFQASVIPLGSGGENLWVT